MKTIEFETDNQTVLKHPFIGDVLVLDCETDSLDTEEAKVKFLGFYSYKFKKYYICHQDEKQAMEHLINEHKILVGFNNKQFDHPVMQNLINGLDLTYKICFDCLAVLYDYERKRPNREVIIKLADGRTLQEALPNRKLRTVGEVLGFSVAKGEINYKIFQKDWWTEEELKEIYTYLIKDLAVTRRIFEFFITYFDNFREYVPEDNVRKLNYIRSSTGSFAYSVLSHLAGIELVFEDDPVKLKLKPVNHGGFVLPPQVDYAEGIIIDADFASLYPHIMFMCNLFSPMTKHEPGSWNGGKLFDLQTGYRCDQLGKIEAVLKQLFMQRLQFKKEKDPREKALKIVINSIYGLSGSPIFKNVFNMTTSGDCTAIGRKMIQYTKQCFEDAGMKVQYSDTDSCFVHMPPGKTMEDFQAVADQAIKEILFNVPFPVDTFKMAVEDVFVKIWFFKKKHYAGFNQRGELTVKGLSVIKHDASHLGKLIFEKLKPIMVEKQNIKFSRDFIKDMIDEEIRNDITLVGQLYNVKNPSSYKSFTSIQCQIAQAFGEGSHILIPNKSLGPVGKDKKYCSVSDADKLSVDDLFLDKVWSELEPFIDDGGK